jgi:carboxyl-terminal processing protease
MKKNIFKAKYYLIPVTFFLFFSMGFKPGGGDDDIYTKINQSMDVFGRVYKEIALNYVDEVDVDKFMRAGIEGMLNTLDPYTNFVDATRKEEVDLLTTGKYGGIGISIGQKDSSIIITEIMEGYSAQKEGLKRGDKILEIDNIPIDIKKINDIRSLVRGTAGTTLKMKISRTDKEIEFTLTRQDIQLKNITYKGMIDDGIGYIKLERFNKYAENEMVDALTELKSNGATRGIILDLRDNPGGLLDAALGILNKFVDKGSLILTTRGRKADSERKYFSTETPLVSRDIPVVVLVNQNSASASEIVAGAMQDLDRGVILGTKTFGKGLVQIYTQLSYGNQLRITNQRYFTPSGRWIQVKNYFKENKYGVFKDNPEFNQNEFKTLDGRAVYAEGGIAPDTVVTLTDNNELLDKLLAQDSYFAFAEKYVYDNPDGSSFVMNDNMINSFYQFLSDPRFEFKTKAEIELDNLSKIISDKNYSDKAKSLVTDIGSELISERLKDFEQSKPVINRLLEMEIMRKYNKPEKDVKAVEFKDDSQVQAALGLIKDKSQYSKLLNITN